MAVVNQKSLQRTIERLTKMQSKFDHDAVQANIERMIATRNASPFERVKKFLDKEIKREQAVLNEKGKPWVGPMLEHFIAIQLLVNANASDFVVKPRKPRNPKSPKSVKKSVKK